MSAALLCCVLVSRILASAANVNGNDGRLVSTLKKDSLSISDNGITIINPSKRIVIEEVDRNGNSVVKELELPNYDESEELKEDRRRREEQKEYQNEEGRWEEMYGCDGGNGSRLRKCLRRQKKLLRQRYRNWKLYIRKIMKDLDGKIKTLGERNRRGSKSENLNFMSGFSPKNVMRKKE